MRIPPRARAQPNEQRGARSMRRLIGRLISVPVTILGAITISFLILHLTPGDPAEIILGDYATPANVAALRSQLGLEQPIYMQYLGYIASVMRGDFGRSLASGALVLEEIQGVLPYTLSLAAASVLVAIAIGIPLGIIAAVRRNGILDYVTMVISLTGISTPIFVLGFVLLFAFSYRIQVFPMIGVGQQGDIADILLHLVLPSLALGLSSAAVIARTVRSSMLEVLSKDYMRTARAKGLAEGAVLWRHAFRNTLIPTVTIIGIQLGTLVGGTVVTESVFSRQGMGKLLVDAILARDYPRVQGAVAIFALMVVGLNLVTEMTYVILDPRVE